MKSLLLLSFIIISYNSNSQVLFTYGKNAVTKSEFATNFLKNTNNLTGDRKKALEENLDLYIKYKLKVQAAYDSKYDTLQNQKEDLQNFRRQIETKYLTEDKAFAALVDEAFERTQKDVRIQHIILLKNKDAAAAQLKANEAFQKLKTGADFAAVAKQYSNDPSVTDNGGDLGYITAFSLPYNMENVAYANAVGSYSQPFESSIGYHIFKVTAVRKALGSMQAAQILIPFVPNGGQDDREAAEKKINEVYTKLNKGEIFENAARAFIGDAQSASAGGLLKEFKVGKYDVAFENTFAKLALNEYSKPFKTSFGWHILKRLNTSTIKTIKDAEVTEQLTALINTDERKAKAEEAFLQSKLGVCGYKESGLNKTDLFALTEQKFSNGNIADSKIKESTILHSFTKQKITVGNYWQFVKDAKATAAFKDNSYENLLKEYVKATLYEYYKNNLEDYNETYREQIKEFKDGNMLFEAMEKNVWNKSSSDTVGLKKYYVANSKKYIWDKSADAIIISVADKNTALVIYGNMQKEPNNWQQLMTKYVNIAQADSGRYELGNIPIAEKTNFTNGMTTVPFSPNGDNNYLLAHIVKLYNEGQLKAFADARGLVINDYQLQLEDAWIAELKKKYTVTVNTKVWNTTLTKGL